MKWPPYSSDLNPIEHVWPHLKESLHTLYPELSGMRGAAATIKSKLANTIIHCWELMDPALLENLARSMPRQTGGSCNRSEGLVHQVLIFYFFILACGTNFP